MKDFGKYVNKWIAFSSENSQVLQSDSSFEKLYSKLDENRKDLVIKYVKDPNATLSP